VEYVYGSAHAALLGIVTTEDTESTEDKTFFESRLFFSLNVVSSLNFLCVPQRPLW
jgi:hypothetical protein